MIDGRRSSPPGTDKSAGADERASVHDVEGATAADGSGADGSKAAGSKSSGWIGPHTALGRRLVAVGVSADHVTVVGMLLAALTGVVIGLGHLWIGVAMVTVGGLMDTLDGAVAKAAGSASKRGAFFDSVSDRVADAFIFGGVAWYFVATHRPYYALLPFAILGVSNTISYERAKAESLGYDAKGGLMERAERLILLGVALAFNIVFIPLLCVLLGLCVVTAVQRFVKVWKQASADTPNALKAAVDVAVRTGTPAAWRPARVESRWRAWREARAGVAHARRRVTISSRTRPRRSLEPFPTRVRKVLTAERTGQVRPRRRTEQRQRGAAASFRRRLGTDR
jgi:CDP-diacylglycerol--glycerol-3-phosphate 3-phosphatidyltransferase